MSAGDRNAAWARAELAGHDARVQGTPPSPDPLGPLLGWLLAEGFRLDDSTATYTLGRAMVAPGETTVTVYALGDDAVRWVAVLGGSPVPEDVARAVIGAALGRAVTVADAGPRPRAVPPHGVTYAELGHVADAIERAGADTSGYDDAADMAAEMLARFQGVQAAAALYASGNVSAVILDRAVSDALGVF